MEIRPATSSDTTSVIELLKKSLGESTIPKSEALWKWKHEENPFGKSYVLIAEENNELVGVRAFMQWQWLWKNRMYKTVRAVDTATHPQHQGKGIFKKLTLQQAELCKQDGIDFIFNTPNTQSKPGYLKMGWVEQGKMPLKLKLLSVIKKAPSTVQPGATLFSNKTEQLTSSALLSNRFITTKTSAGYIKWRYVNNPLFRYHFFTDDKSYLLVCRVKEQSRLRELRIADFFVLNEKDNKKMISKEIKQKVTAFCRQQHINIITLSAQQYKLYKDYFKWMGIIPVLSAGPVVTLKQLNNEADFDALKDVNNWGYSLGDLELF